MNKNIKRQIDCSTFSCLYLVVTLLVSYSENNLTFNSCLSYCCLLRRSPSHFWLDCQRVKLGTVGVWRHDMYEFHPDLHSKKQTVLKKTIGKKKKVKYTSSLILFSSGCMPLDFKSLLFVKHNINCRGKKSKKTKKKQSTIGAIHS